MDSYCVVFGKIETPTPIRLWSTPQNQKHEHIKISFENIIPFNPFRSWKYNTLLMKHSLIQFNTDK